MLYMCQWCETLDNYKIFLYEKKEYYFTTMYFYKDDFSFDFNDKEMDNHKNGSNKGGGTRYLWVVTRK